MSSRTPQFDAVIDSYFVELKPGPRTCPETGETYELTQRDIDTYKQFRVPPSKLVPWARIRRLRASIGGYDLFKRVLPDGKALITMYDPETPVGLVPTPEWMNQRAEDAVLSQGRAYDSTRSFFDQWNDLSLSIPRPAIIQDPKNENSDWSSYCTTSKNAYLCSNAASGRDIVGCSFCNECQFCADIFGCDRDEWGYQLMRVDASSQTMFSQWSVGCVESAFLLGCRNCTSCFGCANLSGKSFCFLNEQLTEAEYRTRLATIDLGDARVLEAWKEKIMREVWHRAYHCAVMNRNTEACIGDDLISCKEVTNCVGLHTVERAAGCWTSMFGKDLVDCATCFGSERSIQSTDTNGGYDYKMSTSCEGCLEVEYSELLSSCEHCFGCIGLYKKRFCILNTQYSEEEYYKFIDQIKTKMLQDGEYGEFFPLNTMLMAYNTSFSDILSPLSREEVEHLGGRWYESKTDELPDARPIEELPLRLSDTTDDVLKKAFRCPMTQRPFRITALELDIHRKLNVALPRIHPTLRRKHLMHAYRPLQFYAGTCALCQVSFQTRIAPQENLSMVCEACYQRILVGELPALVC